MPTFKNKETGETRVFARTRTYIYDDGSKKEIDLATGQEIAKDWELVSHDTDYSSIAAKKSPTDGFGNR